MLVGAKVGNYCVVFAGVSTNCEGPLVIRQGYDNLSGRRVGLPFEHIARLGIEVAWAAGIIKDFGVRIVRVRIMDFREETLNDLVCDRDHIAVVDFFWERGFVDLLLLFFLIILRRSLFLIAAYDACKYCSILEYSVVFHNMDCLI
jgi:hypothetical protein